MTRPLLQLRIPGADASVAPRAPRVRVGHGAFRPLLRRALSVARRIDRLGGAVAGARRRPGVRSLGEEVAAARSPKLLRAATRLASAPAVVRRPVSAPAARTPRPAEVARAAEEAAASIGSAVEEAVVSEAPLRYEQARPDAGDAPAGRPAELARTPAAAGKLVFPEREPPPPDLPDDLLPLWDVWQREKPGGRGMLERSRGARILEGTSTDGESSDAAKPMRLARQPATDVNNDVSAVNAGAGGGERRVDRLVDTAQADAAPAADVHAPDRSSVPAEPIRVSRTPAPSSPSSVQAPTPERAAPSEPAPTRHKLSPAPVGEAPRRREVARASQQDAAPARREVARTPRAEPPPAVEVARVSAARAADEPARLDRAVSQGEAKPAAAAAPSPSMPEAPVAASPPVRLARKRETATSDGPERPRVRLQRVPAAAVAPAAVVPAAVARTAAEPPADVPTAPAGERPQRASFLARWFGRTSAPSQRPAPAPEPAAAARGRTAAPRQVPDSAPSGEVPSRPTIRVARRTSAEPVLSRQFGFGAPQLPSIPGAGWDSTVAGAAHATASDAGIPTHMPSAPHAPSMPALPTSGAGAPHMPGLASLAGSGPGSLLPGIPSMHAPNAAAPHLPSGSSLHAPSMPSVHAPSMSSLHAPSTSSLHAPHLPSLGGHHGLPSGGAEAHAAAGAAGAGGGAGSDHAYREVLGRLREEQEQLGQIVDEPF